MQNTTTNEKILQDWADRTVNDHGIRLAEMISNLPDLSWPLVSTSSCAGKYRATAQCGKCHYTGRACLDIGRQTKLPVDTWCIANFEGTDRCLAIKLLHDLAIWTLLGRNFIGCVSGDNYHQYTTVFARTSAELPTFDCLICGGEIYPAYGYTSCCDDNACISCLKAFVSFSCALWSFAQFMIKDVVYCIGLRMAEVNVMLVPSHPSSIC